MSGIFDYTTDELLFYNERNVSEDSDWAALAAFKFKSVALPSENFAKLEADTAPLDKFFSQVEFTEAVYKEAKQRSIKDWKDKASDLVRATRREYDGHYDRLINLYSTIIKDSKTCQKLHNKQDFRFFMMELMHAAAQPWIFDTLPGTDPQSSWPYALHDLLNKLKQMQPLALWLEPFDRNYELMYKASAFVRKYKQDIDKCISALQVMLLLGYLSGNGTRLTMALIEVYKYYESIDLTMGHVEKIFSVCEPHIQFLSQILSQEEDLRYIRLGSTVGRVTVAQHNIFQKSQMMANTSLTTDGEYLYLFLGTQGGGMFKIGTGEGSTISGKIYLFQAIDKPEDAKWVYVKGKLYMSSANKEAGTLIIICPNTFKNEGLLQLHCPDLYGTPVKQFMNKVCPLLSDGEYLYVVGIKAVLPNVDKQESPKKPRKEQQKEEPMKEADEEPKKIPNEEVKSIPNEEVKSIPNEEFKSIPNEEVKSIPNGEVKSIPDEEVKSKSDEEVKSKSDEEPKIPDEEIKSKPDEEPKILEEEIKEEAKSKPDEEAKSKPEEEAKSKPEEEANNIDEEAKKKAEEEAKKKAEEEANKKAEEEAKKKAEEEAKKKAEEEARKKEEPKICEFLLYKFDVSQIQNSRYSIGESNELAREVYDGFSGYFSITECQRALTINNNDIQSAVQWLVENGDNERGRKIASPKSCTLLCQSEILTYNLGKMSKPEINLKNDSILSTDLLVKGLWTITKDYLAVHSLNPDGEGATARIFSTHESRVKELSEDSHILPNTLNQVGEVSLEPGDLWSQYLKLNKPKRVLKGSHICNRECEYNLFVNECTGCYDSIGKKFYITQLNWNHGIYFYVAADLGLYSEKIQEKKMDLGPKPCHKQVAQGLEFIRKCEIMKFNLPWKWSKSSATFKQSINYFRKLHRKLGDCEEAKRISKLIEKLLQRVDKIVNQEYKELLRQLNLKPISEKKLKKNETAQLNSNIKSSPFYILKSNAKIDAMVPSQDVKTIELYNTKESLFNLESGGQTLRLFSKWLESYPKLVPALLELAFLWSTHAHNNNFDEVALVNVEKQLKSFLMSSERELHSYAWKILINGWSFFCNTPDKESEWLSFILENSDIMRSQVNLFRKDSFLYYISTSNPKLNYSLLYGGCESPLILWYLKHAYGVRNTKYSLAFNQTLTSHFRIYIDKLAEDGKLSKASAVMFKQEEILDTEIVVKHGHILPQTWSIFESALVATISDPSSLETQAIFEIFAYLIKQSYNVENDITDQLLSLLLNLVDIFNNAQGIRVTTLYSKWLTHLRHLITLAMLLYNDKGSSAILQKKIQLFHKIKRIFQTDERNLLDSLCYSFFSGADICNEKVFETSHPYQRGKQQINETMTFPGAIAVSIEVDPRSQSDHHYDCLVISSLDVPAGSFSSYSGEICSPYFKLSGKYSIPYRLILQGNNIHIEFNGSSQPREEGLSNRWGYKIKIKPIYGEPSLFLEDENQSSAFSKLSIRLGGESQVLHWLSLVNSMTYEISNRISKFIKSDSGMTSCEYLKWTILKGGILQPGISEFLIHKDDHYELIDFNKASNCIYTEKMDELINNLQNYHPDLPLIRNKTSDLFKLLKAMRDVQDSPMLYYAEKKRRTFSEENQNYWKQIEAYALYTMLYHTQHLYDMLHWVNTGNTDSLKRDERYINEQLNACGKRVNELISWMLAQVQIERERSQVIMDVRDEKKKKLQQKLEALEETKEEVKSAKLKMMKRPKKNVKRLGLSKPKPPVKKVEKPQPTLDQADKDAIYKTFSERLVGNEEGIKALCKRFNLWFVDQKTSVKEIYDTIWNYEEELVSPYNIVADHVLKRLLLLLLFKPYAISHEQEEKEDELPSLTRAATSFNSESQAKIEEMRKWVNSYKKWKQWQKPSETQEDMTNRKASPLRAIVLFSTMDAYPADIEKIAREQNERAARRCVGFQHMNSFLEIISETPCLRIALGMMPGDTFYDNIESCGREFGNLLNELAKKVFEHLSRALVQAMHSIEQRKDEKSKMGKKIDSKLLPARFKNTKTYLTQQMKLIVGILYDLFTIMNSDVSKEYILEHNAGELLIPSLVRLINLASDYYYHKTAHTVQSTVKLLLYKMIETLQDYVELKIKRTIQDVVIEELTYAIEKELTDEVKPSAIYKLESLLIVMYDVISVSSIKRKEDQVRISRLVSRIISTQVSPCIARLASRIASKVWPSIDPSNISPNFLKDIFSLLGKYIYIHETVDTGKNKETLYTVLLHSTSSDDNLVFLFPLLYEWENRYPTNKYLQETQDEDQPFHEIESHIIDDLLLNSAYFYIIPSELYGRDKDMHEYYSQFQRAQDGSRGARGGRGLKRAARRMGGNKRLGKKVASSNLVICKLDSIFDEILKVYEEIKEEDTEEEKLRKTNEKNFNRRIKHHLRESQTIASNVLMKGVAQIIEPMPLFKALELAHLIQQTQSNMMVSAATKLPVIPNNPYSKIQAEMPELESLKTKKLLQASLCESLLSSKLEYVMESGNNLPTLRTVDALTGVVTGSYSHPLIQKPIKPGASYSQCIIIISRLLTDMHETWHQHIKHHIQDAIQLLNSNLTEQEREYVLGALALAGGWNDYMRPGCSVLAEMNKTLERGVILQGGLSRGQKSVAVVLVDDPSLNIHTLPLSEVTVEQVDGIGSEVPNDIVVDALNAFQVVSPWHTLAQRLLLKLCSRLSWTQYLETHPDNGAFITKLHEISSSCPSDKKPSYWEEYYLQAWEKLVDTRETVDMLVPSSGTHTISSEAFLLKAEDSDDGITGYTLPVSCYLKGLPELQASPADATNFKMRKHWERHIIPRIQDFVRSSFRSYEMEYFFEQLRQPLRNGDQQGASDVAHILCDQRLPSGVVLPDPKHDWNALVLDEAIVGKWFLARLKAKTVHSIDSVLFRRCFYQGVTDLPVICRAVDSRAASVLVEYTDYDKLELHMCWIPISSLYHLECKIHHFGDDLPKLYADLGAKVTGLYARQTLIQCLEGAKTKVPLIDIISMAVWEELSEDRIEGWLTHRLDYLRVSNAEETDKVQQYIHQPELNVEKGRLHWVEEKVIPGNEPELVEWCLMTWTSIGEKIAESARSIDLVETVTALMGPQESLASTPENILAESLAERVVFPIHNEGTNYSGLILCFKKESFLCSNSVIQFYSDPEATDMIYEVRAGRQGRYSLPPILFSTGKVWCVYYTFIDLKCSPYNPNFSGPTVLKCKVFGIPIGWTEVAWTTEALSATLCKNPNSDSISLMHSLLFVMTEFLSSSKSPTPVRQMLFRLMIRMMRRIRYMNSECPTGLGITEEWLSNLVEEIKLWRDNEFSGDETLFSSYVQDGVELISTALLPWDLKNICDPPIKLTIPVWIQAMHNSLMILNYFRKEGYLPLSIEQEVIELLKYNQWSTVFILDNIQTDNIYDNIINTLSTHKLRVLNSTLDIQIFDKQAVIICDGLSLKYYQETDLGEEEKKEEVEEEVKQPEGWECAVCTFINPNPNSACDMCTASKPEVQAKVEAPKTDVRAVEKKLLENMQEAIKELINSLTSNLQCEVKVFNEDEHYSLIKAALRQRVCKDDGLTNDITFMFENFFDHLKPVFGDKPDEAKQNFLHMAQSDAFQLFKTLEKSGIDLWLQKGLGVSKRRLNLKQYEALMDFVEFRMCQETRASLYIPPQFIRLPIGTSYSINYTHQFPGSDLNTFTLEDMRYNWGLLKVFNRYISDCIGLCNLSHHTLLPRGTLSLSTASALSQSRALVLLPIKVEMQQRVFAKTAVTRESSPKVVLERLKFQDSQTKVSVFSKAYEQLKDISTAALRVPKPQGSDPFISFEVVFKGEMVVGEAGPYRQFFADLSKEIVAQNVVKLLCPSPNNREKFGESLDKFVINPSANSAHDLQLFEFFGILMGCCARTGARFTLDLPSYVWKPLTGQNLRFEDVVGIDTPVAEMLKLMENASEELFEESFENFCTRLSDETIVDLKPNGRFIPVTFENKEQYIAAVLACRFSESEKQSQAIREGLSKLVPNALLNLVTWRQLEDWVCGKPNVDIDLLKRHTRYSGGLTESTPRITWFWEILNEFTPEERLKFIKFCWGQERLPGNDEDFERTNTRFMLKPSMNNEYGDGALPKADTCFFNLELPEYTSKEIMRDRIRFAILTDCESMNADNPVSEQQEAGLVRAEHFTDEEGEY